jgi:predicted ATPase
LIHLKSLALRCPGQLPDAFPFNIPVIHTLAGLTFTSPVTFFVGENGSGKSTLLETIACASRAITVGSNQVSSDQSLTHVRGLARQIQLVWSKRTHRGFFLRAEDFFGYARHISNLRQELEEDLRRIDEEYQGRSQTAIDYAKMPYQSELSGICQRYGNGLDSASHGESFLKLFQARFVPNGLYLLDEPEAPLSPSRQLALLMILRQMVEQNAQFIIATHSPILLAFPDAVILGFDLFPIQAMAYEDLEHVRITRDFLNHREAYLQHL